MNIGKYLKNYLGKKSVDLAGRKKSCGNQEYPVMHYQNELEQDLNGVDIVGEKLINKWFHKRYSASKHLPTLYALATGVVSGSMAEVGFGRSSFIFAKVAHEQNINLWLADMKDYSYLLSDAERKVAKFIHGKSMVLWEKLEKEGIGQDLIFLDYFGEPTLTEEFIRAELETPYELLKKNGILCIHDTFFDESIAGKVVKHFAQDINAEYVTLPFNYGLSIIRKKESSVYGEVQDKWHKK